LKNHTNLDMQVNQDDGYLVVSARAYFGKMMLALMALLSLILVSGCTQQASEDLSSKKEIAPQATEEKVASETVKTIIDQGFYSSAETLDELDLNSKPSISNTANEPVEVRTDSTKLVEGLGFSGAQEDAVEVISDKAYCLTDSSLEQSTDIAKSCESIANRLASVSDKACNAAKLEATGCRSVGGFPILLSEFPPLKNKQAQGRILVIGGTHGDELTSVSVVFRWIAKLNKFHSGIFHWHIAPMMNPDGVLNRHASRTNRNGVDLNRNMPSDDWQTNALSYWENQGGKDPRKYPGQSAASEPETQWLIDEINAFQPDAIISVHAPYGVVDFDSLLLNTAPQSLGKLHLNLLGTYPGSLGNYAGINRNIPVITLELPHAWEMPSENESTKIWEDIVSWLRDNIDKRTTTASSKMGTSAE
jgi:hypothetical protein